MNENNSIQNQSRSRTYDIPSLLEFSGPSTRLADPITDGLALIGFRSTDQNEMNISLLLSSQAIPFYMRQEKGWGGVEKQLLLVVPNDRQQDAMDVLNAAAEEGALELAEGMEGLTSY
ncbi:MAG TPA: hypothetical protein VIF81_07790 [Pyrinomonadaceae bacterium]|jgi:hypothetical protein